MPPESALNDLDRGCRAGFLVITALLAYVALRLSWLLWTNPIGKVYESMLKGHPLPLCTRIADMGGQHWIMLSILLAIGALIAGLQLRRPLHALLVIAGCNLALAALAVFLGTALVDPIGDIIKNLT